MREKQRGEGRMEDKGKHRGESRMEDDGKQGKEMT
jgi:hypothetical protein